jgi:hypothetical protein
MDPSTKTAIIAAGAALLGALVGAIAPIVVGLVSSKAETRRERLRIAMQLALADDKTMMAEAKVVADRQRTPISVPPIAITFIYHLRMLDLTDKPSRIGADDVVTLSTEIRKLTDALKTQRSPLSAESPDIRV